MNPCTLGWYLPLIVKDVPGALQPSDGGFGGFGEDSQLPNNQQRKMKHRGHGRGPSEADEREGPSAESHQHAPAPAPASPTVSSPSAPAVSWTYASLDAKFRQDLPNDAYLGRLAYRGLVMRSCPRVRMLDGVEVGAKERAKAERVLEWVGGRRDKTSVGDERAAGQ